MSKYAHIELTADTPVSFRLKVKDLVSPLRFVMEPDFSFGNSMTQTWNNRTFKDISRSVTMKKESKIPVEVLLSTMTKMPSSKNHEIRFFSETMFRVHAE
mmetsp:Transcript_22887/g.35199  ORF Transcript_22887/g.35199 Transcript_22887/m.35199 type:complete len:100 (-) Transcript_22887:76-375(-)